MNYNTLDFIWNLWVSFVKWSTIAIIVIFGLLGLAMVIDGAFLTTVQYIPGSSFFANLSVAKTIFALILFPVGLVLTVWILYFVLIGVWLDAKLKQFIQFLKD